MSKMTDAITRIAICAEQKNFISILRGCMTFNGYDSKYLTTDLSPDEIKTIMPQRYPRLSYEQIEEITKDYPFQLPQEVCELYQRGNGYLPIGIDTDTTKDWSLWDNYFGGFPDTFTIFYPLEEAMNVYRQLTEYRVDGRIDPRSFPIFSNEMFRYVVLGDEQRQETSPLFIIEEDLSAIECCPSLTNLILAYAEILEIDEKRLDSLPNGGAEEIDAIRYKYKVNYIL